jgi:hypothetical protein
MNYKSTATDPHWREEELQWVSILSTGDAARGMALVLLQKMCTAFHEFEPAMKEGALDESKTDFFRGRLANRVRAVIREMKANDLDTIDGAAELSDLLEAVESATSLSNLADLTEDVHLLGHKLCDSLAPKTNHVNHKEARKP